MIQLNDREAVEFNGAYLVKLPYAYGKTVEVNGEVVIGNRVVVLESLDGVYTLSTTPKRLVGYKDPNTGEVIPVSKVSELREPYLDEDGDGELEYPDIETHYRVEKEIERIQSLERVYSESTTTKTPVEFTVIGSLEDTGSEFIETSLSLGQREFRGGGIYKVLRSRIARDEVAKLTELYQGMKIEVPNHGFLKFTKVNGNYVFNNSSVNYTANDNDCFVCSDLKKAREVEKGVRDYVRKEMNVYLHSRKVTLDEVKEIIREIESVQSTVAQIDPKQKSVRTKSHASLKLREFREKLVELINEDLL